MPPPTREQYNEAAKRVMATAPPGLSRDQFYALIDKELAPKGPIPADQQEPLPEGPTVRGFGRNMFESGMDTAGDVLMGFPKLAMKFWQDPKALGGEIAEGVTGKAKRLWNDPLKTLYDDPVGTAADVAGVGALAKMGYKAATRTRPIAAAARTTHHATPGGPYERPTRGNFSGYYQHPERGAAPTPRRNSDPELMVGEAVEQGETAPNFMGGPDSSPGTPPPVPGRPDMVPRGGEAAYNATTPQSGGPSKSPDDVMYDNLIQRMGGRQAPTPPTPTARDMTDLYRGGSASGNWWTDDPNRARNYGSGQTWKTQVPADKASDYLIRKGDLDRTGHPGIFEGKEEFLPGDREMFKDLDPDDPLPDNVPGSPNQTGADRQYFLPPDDPAHDRTMPHGSYSDTMRSTDRPGDWHSGAQPGTPEAQRMSSLHRGEAEMDQDYRRRLGDQKGMIVPDLLLGMFIDEAARKMGVGAIGRKAVKYAPRLAKPLMRMPMDPGLIGRFIQDDPEQEQP